MFGNRKNQNAGSNSNQIQGDNVTVIVGIDEKRAREICSEITVQLKKDYTAEALMVANARILEFENKLLPKMEAVDGALESFADPSFQLLLIQAQKTAAATERPADYDLLAELLVHRFKNDKNRIVTASINRAVEVVDQMADDALVGLTTLYSVVKAVPTTGSIKEGLESLNEFYGKLLYDELPKGTDWFDHLEILDVARINYFNKNINFDDLIIILLKGYIDIGIEKNSKNHIIAKQKLNDVNIEDLLINHSLNNNFVRLNICNINNMVNLAIHDTDETGQSSVKYITEIQKDVIREVYQLYKNDQVIKGENLKIFFNMWDEMENLKKVRLWWNDIKVGVQLTSAGKALANANKIRCEQN